MIQQPTPPCTSNSNCLVATPDHLGNGVVLYSSLSPDRTIVLTADEWAAHLAEVRAAALTEAADFLRHQAGEFGDDELASGIKYAAEVLAGVLPVLASRSSATLTADGAPAGKAR